MKSFPTRSIVAVAIAISALVMLTSCQGAKLPQKLILTSVQEQKLAIQIVAFHPKLSKESVFQIARRYAANHKLNDSDYELAGLTLWMFGDELKWDVFFRTKASSEFPALATDFSILVDDATARPELVPGM